MKLIARLWKKVVPNLQPKNRKVSHLFETILFAFSESCSFCYYSSAAATTGGATGATTVTPDPGSVGTAKEPSKPSEPEVVTVSPTTTEGRKLLEQLCLENLKVLDLPKEKQTAALQLVYAQVIACCEIIARQDQALVTAQASLADSSNMQVKCIPQVCIEPLINDSFMLASQ